MEKYSPDVFLLSAGGNDLLASGNFQRLLYEQGNNSYIREDEFLLFAKKLARSISTVVHRVNERVPGICIFWHSYDYPRSSGQSIEKFGFEIGPWIQPTLVDLGYTNEHERREVVKAVLDSFQNVQLAIIGELNKWAKRENVPMNLFHIDLKGSIPEDRDWPDEIHPDSAANKLLAKKMKDAIHEQAFQGVV